MTQRDDDDLEQLRAIDQADVFKAGQRAATLTRTQDGIEFRCHDASVVRSVPPSR